MTSLATDYDVLIVGAGLSGIGMAAHMKDKVPQHSFAIVERRANIAPGLLQEVYHSRARACFHV